MEIERKVEKDIFDGSGVPKEIVDFFRVYQKHIGKGGAIWYMERNRRFASSFRYHILEGMEKCFKKDFLVAAALLLSHEGSYFECMARPRKELSHCHEVERTQKIRREIANYTAKNARRLLYPSFGSRILSKLESYLGFGIGINTSRYMEFFCDLPLLWKYEFEKTT